jgi:hypothetical protein
MISQRLVQLIESHADELTKRWLKDVRHNKDTPGYHTFPESELFKRAFDVYSHLGRWIGSEEHRAEVERDYTALGAARFREGFALSEVVEALFLTKRHLWWYVREHGSIDSAVHLYQSLELFECVARFFDRAVHHAVVGYEGEAGLPRRKVG